MSTTLETTTTRLLMLHSTCCYFHDTLHAVCELESHPLFSGFEFHHVLVAPGTCTYEYQLPSPNDVHCRKINGKALDYLRKFRGVVHLLENILQKPPFDSASLTIESLDTLIYKDIGLWAAVKPSVAAYLQWENTAVRLGTVSGSEWNCIKEFLCAAAKYIDAYETLLKQIKPTHCILFNGYFYRERVMVEVCRRHGVNVLAVERSTFADLKHVSQTGVVGNRNDWALLGADWGQTRRLNSLPKKQLDSFMRCKFSGVNNFIPQPIRTKGLRERLRIGKSKKVVVFFGQVPHDSVLAINDSELWNMPRAVSHLLELFALKLPEVILVIRLHPGGEVSSLRVDHMATILSKTKLPDNVRVIAGISENTHDLMKLAHVAMTVSSQAGLEFLWLHKPLIHLGDAYYGNKGLTWDVKTEADLEAALKLTLQCSTLSPLQCQRIDVFLFGLIFEYLVPFSRSKGVFTDAGCMMIANMLSGRARLFRS